MFYKTLFFFYSMLFDGFETVFPEYFHKSAIMLISKNNNEKNKEQQQHTTVIKFEL